ncbi:disks large-associated protein 4 isoform X1 [Lates japonicus]|uniref:Disks large-associated protein 4 isoform X1 n=1 Tax=Lates japonicus TaxID=270547 RepID=A0AAD3N1A0_LATJO|nr:disks large-associated protein 4 isoform X1 [Lates japonicus]
MTVCPPSLARQVQRGQSSVTSARIPTGGVTVEVISQLFLAWRSSRGLGLLAIMKGLGTNRNRHLSDSCDPSSGHPEALYPQKTSTLPRSPYLLSPTMDHYGTMDPPVCPSANQAFSTRLHAAASTTSCPTAAPFPGSTTTPMTSLIFLYLGTVLGAGTGTMGTSMSMGMERHGMAG